MCGNVEIKHCQINKIAKALLFRYVGRVQKPNEFSAYTYCIHHESIYPFIPFYKLQNQGCMRQRSNTSFYCNLVFPLCLLEIASYPLIPRFKILRFNRLFCEVLN